MPARKIITLGAAIACVVAALLVARYWATDASPPPQPNNRLAEAPQPEPPQLHCVLIGYTGEARLAFLFNISQSGNEPHFEQLYLVEINGPHKTKKEPPFPAWRFSASAEPARLESEINVFDDSAAGSHTETITIELYDYRPEDGSSGFIESGLKSIHYQNLSGHCQQSRPATRVSTSN